MYVLCVCACVCVWSVSFSLFCFQLTLTLTHTYIHMQSETQTVHLEDILIRYSGGGGVFLESITALYSWLNNVTVSRTIGDTCFGSSYMCYGIQISTSKNGAVFRISNSLVENTKNIGLYAYSSYQDYGTL